MSHDIDQRCRHVVIGDYHANGFGQHGAAGSSEAKQARRLLSLAMVLDGHPRLLAVQAGGVDRQTLRDWVHRYNEHGVDGLRDTRNKGRAPALSAEQMQTLRDLVLAGPDLRARQRIGESAWFVFRRGIPTARLGPIAWVDGRS